MKAGIIAEIGNALICAAAVISLIDRKQIRYTNFATAYGLVLYGWALLLWLFQG
jgi:hypothetical protein